MSRAFMGLHSLILDWTAQTCWRHSRFVTRSTKDGKYYDGLLSIPSVCVCVCVCVFVNFLTATKKNKVDKLLKEVAPVLVVSLNLLLGQTHSLSLWRRTELNPVCWARYRPHDQSVRRRERLVTALFCQALRFLDSFAQICSGLLCKTAHLIRK